MMARSTLARALAPLLALGLGGCTVIADLDSYQTDRGCDLDLQLIDFSAHFSGPHRMEFFVVKPDSSGDGGTGDVSGTLASLLVLEPTPSIDFDISMPSAVPSTQHEIRFYADTDNNGVVEPEIDGLVQDHTWILTNGCDPRPNPFRHVFEFQEFTRPKPFGTDLVVRFSQIEEAGGAFELRVVVDVPDPSDATRTVERTVGAYHKPTRDDGAGTSIDPFVVRLPGIVDAGFDYTLEVWADGNANGTFDTSDGNWRVVVPGTSLDDPSTPFEFDVTLAGIVSGAGEHSGTIVVTTR